MRGPTECVKEHVLTLITLSQSLGKARGILILLLLLFSDIVLDLALTWQGIYNISTSSYSPIVSVSESRTVSVREIERPRKELIPQHSTAIKLFTRQ